MDDLSIIIPVRSGEETYKDLLQSLLRNPSQFEILIVGPDFHDKKSENQFNDPRVRFIYSPIGRARQQNTAALKASRTFIWFLHADSQTSADAIDTIQTHLKKNPEALFFFDLAFLDDGSGPMILNGLGAYYRSHLLKMPFGDQGFFMSRRNFIKLGLFNEEASYGEDHLLVWKARQTGMDILPCHKKLFTSARKYKNKGWAATTLRHVYLTYLQAFPEWKKVLFQKNKKKSSTAVAIFVKTPGVSTVKSRLAADVGVGKAEEFFHLSLKATEATVIESMKQSKGDIQGYWAVAEQSSLYHPLWKSFETISQGTGGLGDRLAEVYSQLQKKHDRVFLIGADLPHMEFKVLLDAHQKLKNPDQFIMGMTDDGGFYLFGGRKKIESQKWNSVTYSSETTASELINVLGKDHFVFLEKNFDIDFVQDLKKLSELSLKDLLPEQLQIIEWAKKIGLPY